MPLKKKSLIGKKVGLIPSAVRYSDTNSRWRGVLRLYDHDSEVLTIMTPSLHEGRETREAGRQYTSFAASSCLTAVAHRSFRGEMLR
jgi:hypothetical protein